MATAEGMSKTLQTTTRSPRGSRVLQFDGQNSCHSDETTPLSIDETGKLKGEGQFHPYNIDDLINLNVFLKFRGTVFECKQLWIETGVMAMLFWCTAAVMYYHRPPHFSLFVGKEVNIRAFISMFSTLIGLLLSFYTALNLGRWWQMRLAVQQVQEGCKTLTMYLAHGVTSDPEVLDKVQKYARCSLFLLFKLTEGGCSPREEALKNGFLTQEESDALQRLNPHMTFVQAEALWAWLANIVARLNEQGLVKGPPHYCALMKSVDQGRLGISAIQTFLETPIPMGYVHLLCFMVKLHNFILTTLMALLLALKLSHEGNGEYVDIFRASFRAFFMPFLYNAILQLNAEVTNPFGDDAHDFDGDAFDTDLQAGANSLAGSAKTLPPFLSSNRTFHKWQPTYESLA
jgi:hypothetical protein|mmetsp:Transcript_36145/g.57814  ORF Transcript_36145/g.57814 Transcript_36145/m.57814 type:complete len:402 (-) Transcript_36145:95-1300(-)